ncbi:DUF916 domain-containing protein [Candidatus Saccharibacteria bacterium]|nr:DUF916 domain-containing protein [Candidatus Saccharibacteria bacterium]
MERLKKLRPSLILITVIYFLVNSLPALAAPSGINLTTSPLPINLSANPGSTITTDLRIQNSSSQTQKIKTSLMKFSAYGESGKPALQDRAPGDDYFDWVSFSPQTFQAPPNQWVIIKMTIKIPKAAAFGYYYAVVFSPADQNPQGKGNKFIGSTAILVLLDVKSPNAKRSAKIAGFSVDHKIYEFLPVDFNVRLHNDGNVHLLPAGTIYIKRGSKQVAAIPFNSQHGNILPNSYRIYTSGWSDGWPAYINKQQDGKVLLDKNGQPVKQLSWNANKISHLKFGHYTANLLAAYDNGKRDVPLEASVSFWVIPWRLLAIFVGLLGLVGGLITYVIILRRRLKRAGSINRGSKV